MRINVTEPFLPDLALYQEYLSGIWSRCWLTNHGPLVNELESKLTEYLGADHMLFLTNGTVALQIAIKALNLTGEVITTPFSYVATTSSIVWENCTPVMADIDPETCNIDPESIRGAITDKTTAILATHVYGNACDVEAIEAIAKEHNLKVIYDGAHAFGTRYKGKSLFSYGDISTASFHATKLFHTIEGGAVFTSDPSLLKAMSLLRNFGHTSPTSFALAGINGKNSEFHAAMGLCNLRYIDDILARRKTLCDHYDHLLAGLPISRPRIQQGCDYNYAYYPVMFESEAALLSVMNELEKHSILCRRYFYPSLSTLPYVKNQHTPVCEGIAARVLCLPLYHRLSEQEAEMVATRIRWALKYGQNGGMAA